METLLLDDDQEVRARPRRRWVIFGYVMVKSSRACLSDASPRVVFHAGVALRRHAEPSAVEPIVAMLKRQAGNDVYLRHAAIMAMTGVGEVHPEKIAQLSDHPNQQVRLCAVVALRNLRSPEVTAFLGDSSVEVVRETARAIYDDFSIPPAMPALAARLSELQQADEPIVRRAMAQITGSAMPHPPVAWPDSRPKRCNSCRATLMRSGECVSKRSMPWVIGPRPTHWTVLLVGTARGPLVQCWTRQRWLHD